MKILPFLLVAAVLICSGCISPTPGTSPAPSPVENRSPLVPTVTTGTVTVTPGTTGLVPDETPITAIAYVKRPYGYVQYEYNPAHSVRLLSTDVEKDPSGFPRVTGTIKNTGKERIDLVVVTIHLLDADGEIIDSVSEETQYLEPGKTWKYRTEPVTLPDFKSQQVVDIFTG